MNLLPIVFTCDDHYFKYTNVVICSIIHNSNRHTKYEINVLSEFISEENKLLANEQIEKYSNFSIKYHILYIKDPEKYHLNSYMSLSTYYRFFIFDLLKNYERVLYLDSDLIVDNDISFYSNIDFQNNAVICSASPYVQNLLSTNTEHDFTRDYFYNHLNMKEFSTYFNAGVILFNLKLIRNQKIGEKLFQAIQQIKNPIFQDQDILNSVFYNNGGIKIISGKFNYTKGLKISLSRIFINSLKKKIGTKRNEWFTTYHYVGKLKPWQKYNQDSSLFLYYAYKTPFIKDILKNNDLILSKILKLKLYLISKF